jgi:hypothetical protein
VTEAYDAARTALPDGLAGPRAALAQATADAAAEKYGARYIADQRARAVAAAKRADEDAARQFAAAYDSSMAEARRARARAEADVDPAARLADLTERAVLAKGDPDALAAQARAMLDADRPQRAALLLDAAADAGYRRADVGDLRSAVEEKLDEAIPERKRARDIEAAAREAADAFRAGRLRLFVESGFGVASDGSAGSGDASEVARASVSSKVAAMTEGRGTAA